MDLFLYGNSVAVVSDLWSQISDLWSHTHISIFVVLLVLQLLPGSTMYNLSCTIFNAQSSGCHVPSVTQTSKNVASSIIYHRGWICYEVPCMHHLSPTIVDLQWTCLHASCLIHPLSSLSWYQVPCTHHPSSIMYHVSSIHHLSSWMVMPHPSIIYHRGWICYEVPCMHHLSPTIVDLQWSCLHASCLIHPLSSLSWYQVACTHHHVVSAMSHVPVSPSIMCLPSHLPSPISQLIYHLSSIAYSPRAC